MPVTNVTVTIPAGQSLSNAIDITAGRCIRIVMPDDWTPANITFQIATANIEADFREVHLIHNGAAMMVGCMPGYTMAVRGDAEFAAEGWMKLRSGTAALPIVQEADRVFTLVVLR